MSEPVSIAAIRRTLLLQAIHNGRVELEKPPSPELDSLLSGESPWLRLLEPTHSWPAGMLRRMEFGSPVKTIAFPPDGCPDAMWQWLAVGCYDGWIYIMNGGTGCAIVLDGQELRWRAHETVVASMDWSPEGMLASGGDDGVLCLWDPRRKERLRWARRDHFKSVRAVDWSPDGMLASGGDDGAMGVWDPRRKEPLVWKGRGHSGPVTSIAWGPGNLLACGSADSSVSVWKWQQQESSLQPLIQVAFGELQKVAPGEPQWLRWLHGVYVTWSPGGLLAAGSGLAVGVWDPERMHPSGRRSIVPPLWTSHEHKQNLTAVSWSHGGLLASGRMDRTITVWDFKRIEPARSRRGTPPLWRFAGHDGIITSIAWGSGGLLASGSTDGTVAVWNLKPPERPRWTPGIPPLTRRAEHDDIITSVAWSSGGLLASGTQGGIVAIWDLNRPAQPLEVLNVGYSIMVLSWSPDERYVAVARDNGKSPLGLLTWKRRKQHWWVGPQANINSLVWKPHGVLVSGGTGRGYSHPTVVEWSPGLKDEPWTSYGDGSEVTSLSWGNHGMLATGDRNGRVQVWSFREGQSWKTMCSYENVGEHQGEVTSVAWGHGLLLASASDLGTLAVWDLSRQEYQRFTVELQTEVRAVSWSPDGKCLATRTANRQIYIVDALNGRIVWRCGTNAGILAFRWSDDGREVWAADNGGGTGRPHVYRVRLEGDAWRQLDN